MKNKLCIILFVIFYHLYAMENTSVLDIMKKNQEVLATGKLASLFLLDDSTLLTRSNKKQDSAWGQWNIATKKEEKLAYNDLLFTKEGSQYTYFSRGPRKKTFCIQAAIKDYEGVVIMNDENIDNDTQAGPWNGNELITSLKWTGNGLIYIALDNGSTRAFNPQQVNERRQVTDVRTYPVKYSTFSPQGTYGLLELENKYSIERFYTRDEINQIPKIGNPWLFAWSPDESEIACPTENVVKIYDILTGKKRLTIDPKNGEVFYIQYDTSGNQLFVATNNRISMFETVSGKLLQQLLYDTKNPHAPYLIKMFTVDPKETTIAAYINQENNKDNFVAVFDIGLKNTQKENTKCSIQ